MMRQPPSIRDELNNAVIGGIRLRGPEAMGLILLGLAGTIVVALILGVLLALAAIFSFKAIATLLAGSGGLVAALNWLLANPQRRRRP